ncbi:MAG: phosphonate ABC transporter, permease protein PhnE [Pseudobdellovibrionaceae bacterium]|nr:phosphonate ABC transporter, permease protein PhnE [Pseudobdellovibrionaceae bacterium]
MFKKDMKEKLKSFVFDGIMGSYLFLILVTDFFPLVGLESLTLDLFDENDRLMLDYATQWFLVGFFVLGFLSYVINESGLGKTLGEFIFEPPHKKSRVTIERPRWAQVWFWQIILFLFFTVLVSIRVTEFSFSQLFDEDGFAGVLRLINGLATPNWKLLPKAVSSIVVTIFMAFIATFLAIPVAFVLSFLAAKNIMKSPVGFTIYLSLRTIFNVVRSIEALIWAIIFSVWVGIGPFAGMLALMMHSIASLAKQYSEIIETVSDGPIEGIASTGARPFQVIWFAIVPQVVLPFISFTIYRWDINIRMATVVGLVGGGGIGTLFIQYSGQAMWHEVGTIILVIAFVVWFMDTASAYLREALK